VFIFGQDLPPRTEPYTPADVDAAIARTHMALELMHSRYADLNAVSFADNLADGLVNQGLFIGPEVDAEAARATAQMTITVTYADGTSSQHQGKHPNGQPRAPLYWLAEFLRQRGEGIVAGQAVITGSFAGILDVPLSEAVVIDYEGLGRMTVNFNARQPA
jgi:2-keto-4-pentenoate hydratase